MSTYREVYFSLLKKNNKYANSEAILDLFCYISSYSKEKMMLCFDEEFPSEQYILFERLLNGEPIQYIKHYAEFLGEKFFVTKDTLIPRQETEQLVLNSIKYIKEHFKGEKVKILDVGTGCGIIGISLKEKLDSDVTLLDISKDALEVAKNNAVFRDLKLTYIESDMLSNVHEKYDVIIANPPYIHDETTVDEQVLKYEPHLALFDKNNDIFEKLLHSILDKLSKRYMIALEIEEDDEMYLTSLINKYLEKSRYFFEKDIYGKTRFVYIFDK